MKPVPIRLATELYNALQKEYGGILPARVCAAICNVGKYKTKMFTKTAPTITLRKSMSPTRILGFPNLTFNNKFFVVWKVFIE